MSDLNSEDYVMYLFDNLPQISIPNYYTRYYYYNNSGALIEPKFSSEMKISLYLKTVSFFKEKGLLTLNSKGTKYVASLDKFTTLPQRDREIFAKLIDHEDFKFVIGQPSSKYLDTLSNVIWGWVVQNELIVKNYTVVGGTDETKVRVAKGLWTGGGIFTAVCAGVGSSSLFLGDYIVGLISLGGFIAGGSAYASGFPVWAKRGTKSKQYDTYASLSDKGKKWIIEQHPDYNISKVE